MTRNERKGDETAGNKRRICKRKKGKEGRGKKRGRGGVDKRQTVLGHNHVRLFRAAVSIVNIRERMNFISSVNITSLLLLCSNKG